MKAFPNEACVIHINHPVDPSYGGYGKRKAVLQIMPSDERINSAAIVELKFLPPKFNAKISSSVLPLLAGKLMQFLPLLT